MHHQEVKIKYDKRPKTFEEQLALLKERGMIVDDDAPALHALSHCNYYRLRGYWIPFEERDPSTAHGAGHKFQPGTYFNKILDLYQFDSKLRLLLLEAITAVEISVRTQFAYQLAHETKSAHPHLDPSLFNKVFPNLLGSLGRQKSILEQNHFIKHYEEKYEECLPPIWVVVEIMSLNQLSKWYCSIRQPAIRQKIADIYRVDETILTSWLSFLTPVRNRCAHHERLWNHKFIKAPTIPKKKPADLGKLFNKNQRKRIYTSLVILDYLYRIIDHDAGKEWKERLRALLKKHDPDTTAMGFPDDKTANAFWEATHSLTT